jgi:hypothetical protein
MMQVTVPVGAAIWIKTRLGRDFLASVPSPTRFGEKLILIALIIDPFLAKDFSERRVWSFSLLRWNVSEGKISEI